MTDRELMQQTLDLLDDIDQCSLPPTGIPLPAEIDHVMEALRACLAQPEPEPVTQYSDIVSDGGLDLRNKSRREWVGLTDEEIKVCAKGGRSIGISFHDAIQKAEAKLKEKNT